MSVDVDGTLIEGVFYFGVQEHDLAREAVPEGGVESVGWINGSDTGEIDGFCTMSRCPRRTDASR